MGSKYSQSSFFTIVRLYKVTWNNELANDKSLFLGEIHKWMYPTFKGKNIELFMYTICQFLKSDLLFGVF